MKEWNYDTLNGLDWRKISKTEQLSILEKHYPIGMYIEFNFTGNENKKSIITGYDYCENGIFIVIDNFYTSLHPFYIKPGETPSISENTKITESELFEIGWRRFGDEEDDPYYKLLLNGDVFGLYELAGNFQNDDFKIYGIHNRSFSNINELSDLVKSCGFVLDHHRINKYGSNKVK